MTLIQENKFFTLNSNATDSQFLNMFLSDKNEEISLSGEGCPFFEKSVILDNQIVLDFNLTNLFVEEKKDVYEVKLYIEKSKNLKISVDVKPANTFQLDEPVEVCFFDKKLQVEFSLIEGEGNFWGHIYYSNRPSRAIRDQFQAHDWMIGLRTVKRSLNCRVRAKINFF